MESIRVGAPCESCVNGRLRIMRGKRGPFIGCDAYPKCRYTESMEPERDEYMNSNDPDIYPDSMFM